MVNGSPIFFIGTGRNGSTLIGDLIGNHPDLGWISNYQNKFPKHTKISSMNQLFRNDSLNLMGATSNTKNKINYINRLIPRQSEAYSFWDYHTQTNFSKNSLFLEKANEDIQKNLINVINNILAKSNKSRFFSKITGPGRISFIQSIFPTAKFVHIIRDPRHTLNSFLKVDYWVNEGGLEKPWWENLLIKEDLNFWENNKTPEVLTALQIKRIILNINKVSSTLSEKNFIEIRYEDFLSNRIEEFNRLSNFLDLEITDSILNELTSKNIYKSEQKVPFTENETIHSIFLPILEQYNYSF